MTPRRKFRTFKSWTRALHTAVGLKPQKLRAPTTFRGSVHSVKIGRIGVTEIDCSSYSGTFQEGSDPGLVHVVLMDRGALSLSRDSIAVTGRGRQAFLLPAATGTLAVQATPLHNLTLHIPAADIENLAPGWKRSIGVVTDIGSGAGAHFFDVVRSLARYGTSFEDGTRSPIGNGIVDLYCCSLLNLSRGSVRDIHETGNAHRARVRAYIVEHLREPGLDVARIGQELGLSPRHIHRLFSNEQEHVIEWMWGERLRHCYAELSRASRQHRSVAQVAEGWGFADPAHFSRAFRKQFGLKPSEVRPSNSSTGSEWPLAAE